MRYLLPAVLAFFAFPAMAGTNLTPLTEEPTSITVSGSSAGSTCPNGQICMLVCDVDVRLEFGDAAVTADGSSGFWPARTVFIWTAHGTSNGAQYFSVIEYDTGVGGKCSVFKMR